MYKINYNYNINQEGGFIDEANCEEISQFISDFILNKSQAIKNHKDIFTKNTDYLILANLCYLFDIDIYDLEISIELKSKLETKIIQKGYEEPISNEFDKSKKIVKVWNKNKYIYENFWKLDIDSFFTEYYRFLQEKKSYKLYWDNIINLLTLLCRIKACGFYYIDVTNDGSGYEKLEEIINSNNNKEYDEMLSKVKMINDLPLNNNLYSELGIKLVYTELNDINLIDLRNGLLNCFNCQYDNIEKFYKLLLKELFDNEFQNLRYDEQLSIKDINQDMEGIFLFLSLNLPKDEIYARNEFTKIVCTSLNGLKLIDNLALSMNQIVGHDFYFHNASNRKKQINGNEIDDFNQIKKYLTILDEENIDKTDKTDNNETFNPFNIHLNNFIISSKKKYSKFFNQNGSIFSNLEKNIRDSILNISKNNLNKLLENIHYLFHERASTLNFSIKNFIFEVNGFIRGQNEFVREFNQELCKFMIFLIFLIKITSPLKLSLSNNAEELALILQLILDLQNDTENNIYKNLFLEMIKLYRSEILKDRNVFTIN